MTNQVTQPAAFSLSDALKHIESLLAVLHPGAVGLIEAHHGKEACAKACVAIQSAKAFLEAHPTEYTLTMRSVTTFGFDTTTLQVFAGQSVEEVAEKVAASYGATVESISGPVVLAQASESGDQPDEEAISKFLMRQLLDGDLPLEEIPAKMARFALAKPADMRAEFAERMGL